MNDGSLFKNISGLSNIFVTIHAMTTHKSDEGMAEKNIFRVSEIPLSLNNMEESSFHDIHIIF